MTVGEKITQLRKNAGMTQAQLGEKLNVSSQAVSKWEHGQAEPDISTIKSISMLFSISIDDLLDAQQDVAPTSVVETKQVVSDVSKSVEDLFEKHTQEKILGYCTCCGTAVTETNKGVLTPKVICKECVKQDKKNRRDKESRTIEENKKLMKKTFIWGTVAAVVSLFFNFIWVIDNFPTTQEKIGFGFFAVLLAYGFFAVVGELIIGYGVVPDILFFFLDKPLKLPGLIFSLDIEGCLFFIIFKIAGAILGFLVGLILFLIGLVLSLFIAPFAYPVHLIGILRENNKQNEKIKNIKED